MKYKVTIPIICFAFIAVLACFKFAVKAEDPERSVFLRVMTYNIRNGQGMDDQTDYDRTAAVIADMHPDVIALQEVDSVTNRSQQADVLQELAKRTKMYATFSASIVFDGGKYGIGVLSKEKPLAWQRFELPGREEKRSLLLVEFPDYVFACTHFSLHEEDRLASVEIIRNVAERYEKPVILAGDFNDSPDSSVLSRLEENWQLLSDVRQFTYPSDAADDTIDYLLGYRSEKFACSIVRNGVLNNCPASDHLPLFADIYLKSSLKLTAFL
jgi:endonuclease/exonuclease/phosphatase family metal-dependent hydrolase